MDIDATDESVIDWCRYPIGNTIPPVWNWGVQNKCLKNLEQKQEERNIQIEQLTGDASIRLDQRTVFPGHGRGDAPAGNSGSCTVTAFERDGAHIHSDFLLNSANRQLTLSPGREVSRTYVENAIGKQTDG